MSGLLIDTARPSVDGFNDVARAGATSVAERQGDYRGETVRPANQASQMSTAAATRGLSVQAALRNDLATLAQRTIAQGQAADIDASARVAELRDKLPDIPGPREFGRLIAQFEAVDQQLSIAEGMQGAEEDIAAEIGAEHAEREEVTEERSAEETRETPIEQGEDGSEPPTTALARALLARRDSQQGGEFSGEGGGESALREIFGALEKFDSDPTHQFAALENLRSYFKDARVEFQLILDKAMAVYESNTDLAQAVRAGYAAAEVAHRAAATLRTDPRKVRDAYRAMLREQPNLGTLFDALIEKFGLTSNFEGLVETFLAAAGHDLASTGPSTDEMFLHALTTELGKLKKMRTVFEDGKELIKVTDRIAPRSERGKLEPLKLTSRILNFCGKRSAVTVPDARVILAPLVAAPPQLQVVFINALIDLHARIPGDIMPSPQALLQQKTVLGTLRNQLVEAEEIAYESAAHA